MPQTGGSQKEEKDSSRSGMLLTDNLRALFYNLNGAPKVSLNNITNKARTDFHRLFSKLWDYVEKYDKLYDTDDARIHFFIVSGQLNLWLMIQLDSFLEIIHRTNDYRINKYLTIDPDNRSMFLTQYDTINRASYTSKGMFEVEHFLKLIGLSLGMKRINKYSRFIEEFLKKIDSYQP